MSEQGREEAKGRTDAVSRCYRVGVLVGYLGTSTSVPS
jgi:hypothetical protein